MDVYVLLNVFHYDFVLHSVFKYMILNFYDMSALIQMRERFLKNRMNGQFFEKMKWKQFLYIFNHGLRGKYL